MENTDGLFLGELANQEHIIDFIIKEFQTPRDSVSCFEFYVAYIDNGGYEGTAYFLMKHQETGDFYEVYASHCSCYGFEGEWEPKIAPKAYLVSDKFGSTYLASEYKDYVKQFVKQLFS